MPRFVVLTHDHPVLHWDFLLEGPETARTWRLHRPPALHATIPAESIAPHRLMYLDYEGPVSGERGSVARWDWGSFEWIDDADGRLQVSLKGEILRGTATLVRADASSSSNEWTFRLEETTH